jgi:hypothetical protein
MKVKSLCSLTEAAGAEGAVKTAIKYQIENSTDLVPHHAAKSTIVRGALKQLAMCQQHPQFLTA